MPVKRLEVGTNRHGLGEYPHFHPLFPTLPHSSRNMPHFVIHTRDLAARTSLMTEFSL